MAEKMKKGEFFKLVNQKGPSEISTKRIAEPFKAPRVQILLVSKQDGSDVTCVHTVTGPGLYKAGKPIELRERKFQHRIDKELKRFNRWLDDWKKRDAT